MGNSKCNELVFYFHLISEIFQNCTMIKTKNNITKMYFFISNLKSHCVQLSIYINYISYNESIFSNHFMILWISILFKRFQHKMFCEILSVLRYVGMISSSLFLIVKHVLSYFNWKQLVLIVYGKILYHDDYTHFNK